MISAQQKQSTREGVGSAQGIADTPYPVEHCGNVCHNIRRQAVEIALATQLGSSTADLGDPMANLTLVWWWWLAWLGGGGL